MYMYMYIYRDIISAYEHPQGLKARVSHVFRNAISSFPFWSCLVCLLVLSGLGDSSEAEKCITCLEDHIGFVRDVFCQ